MDYGQIVSFVCNAKGCPTSQIMQSTQTQQYGRHAFVYVCCLSTPTPFVRKTDLPSSLLWKPVSLMVNVHVKMSNLPASPRAVCEHSLIDKMQRSRMSPVLSFRAPVLWSAFSAEVAEQLSDTNGNSRLVPLSRYFPLTVLSTNHFRFQDRRFLEKWRSS